MVEIRTRRGEEGREWGGGVVGRRCIGLGEEAEGGGKEEWKVRWAAYIDFRIDLCLVCAETRVELDGFGLCMIDGL